MLASALAPSAVAETASGRSGRYEWFGVEDREREMHLCVLLPYRNCDHAFDVAIAYGGGTVWGGPEQADPAFDLGNDSMQLLADGGYLHRVHDAPAILIGPLVGFEAEQFRDEWRFRLQASARLRMWLGEWVTLEAAVGVVGSFELDFSPRGVGGLVDLGLTLHGHLGAYVQTQVIDGPEGVETRVTAGFRGSLVTWAVIFAGMAG
jgi:hypothetical protein